MFVHDVFSFSFDHITTNLFSTFSHAILSKFDKLSHLCVFICFLLNHVNVYHRHREQCVSSGLPSSTRWQRRVENIINANKHMLLAPNEQVCVFSCLVICRFMRLWEHSRDGWRFYRSHLQASSILFISYMITKALIAAIQRSNEKARGKTSSIHPAMQCTYIFKPWKKSVYIRFPHNNY